MEIGRLCVKLAGRDAGRICAVVDTIDNTLVLIDGNVRRRKCNIHHLEALPDTIKIKKGASHSDVADEFKRLKIPVWHTKAKPKTQRIKAVRKQPSAKVEKVKAPKQETKAKEAPTKKAPAKKSAAKKE
jgi:large subunit ribosomal protein L14e